MPGSNFDGRGPKETGSGYHGDIVGEIMTKAESLRFPIIKELVSNLDANSITCSGGRQTLELQIGILATSPKLRAQWAQRLEAASLNNDSKVSHISEKVLVSASENDLGVLSDTELLNLALSPAMLLRLEKMLLDIDREAPWSSFWVGCLAAAGSIGQQDAGITPQDEQLWIERMARDIVSGDQEDLA